MLTKLFPTLLALGLLLAPATLAQAADHAVAMRDMQFHPATLNIEVGDTVTWTNQEKALHRVDYRGDDLTIDSPKIPQNESFSFTFTTAGTFNYGCGLHPQMKGTIVVGGGGDDDDEGYEDEPSSGDHDDMDHEEGYSNEENLPIDEDLPVPDDDSTMDDNTEPASRATPSWAVNSELPADQRRPTDANPATGNTAFDNKMGYREAMTHEIKMTSTIYEPATITIYVGDTVKWINVDSVSHSTMSQDNVAYDGVAAESLDWESPVLKKGGTWSRTFNVEGTYIYFDGADTGMSGQIIVLPKGDPHTGEAG